jgi:polysaccharide export outer membrane protein
VFFVSRAPLNYQGIDGIAAQENLNSYEIKIQPDDLLMIIVSAEDPEISMPSI